MTARRAAVLFALVPMGGALTVRAASAGPVYLSQARFVEASVDGGDPVGDLDLDRRDAPDLGPFDQAAAASFTEAFSGLPASSAVRQVSTLGDAGIAASFDATYSSNTLGLYGLFRAGLSATFSLDQPYRYALDPLGPAPSLVLMDGSGFVGQTATATLSGPGVNLSIPLADNASPGAGVDPGSNPPAVGELAAGTYTFTFEVGGDALLGSGAFALAPSLSLTPVTDGPTEGPAVVPLPAGSLAGLATLGGIGLAGAVRGRGRAKSTRTEQAGV